MPNQVLDLEAQRATSGKFRVLDADAYYSNGTIRILECHDEQAYKSIDYVAIYYVWGGIPNYQFVY